MSEEKKTPKLKRKHSSKNSETKEKKRKKKEGKADTGKRRTWDPTSKTLPGIHLTGARPGELIMGHQKRVKACLMQLADDSGVLGPCKQDLDAQCDTPESKAIFLTWCQQHLSFFNEMNLQEIEAWLRKHQQPGKKLDMPLVKDVNGKSIKLKLLEIGKAKDSAFNDPTALPLETVQQIQTQCEEQGSMTAKEIYDEFIQFNGKKPMWGHANFWHLVTKFYICTKRFDGIVLHVPTGERREYSLPNEHETMYIIDSTNDHPGVCIVVDSVSASGSMNDKPFVASREQLVQLVDSMFLEPFPHRDKAYLAMAYLGKKLTSGMWKSMLQKFPRFGALQVDITLAWKAMEQDKVFDELDLLIKARLAEKMDEKEDGDDDDEEMDEKEQKETRLSAEDLDKMEWDLFQSKRKQEEKDGKDEKEEKDKSPLMKHTSKGGMGGPQVPPSQVPPFQLLVPLPYFTCMTFAYLCSSPGSMVPDIQRFVRGIEAAFKRTGVLIAEDVYVRDPRKLNKLMSAALLSQRCSTWKPSKRLVEDALAMLKDACDEPKCFDWHGKKVPLFQLLEYEPQSTETSEEITWKTAAAVISTLRSFEGDEQLFSFLATHQPMREPAVPPYPPRSVSDTKEQLPKKREVIGNCKSSVEREQKEKKEVPCFRLPVVPIFHGLDQHIDPSGLVYCQSPALLEKMVKEAKENSSYLASQPHKHYLDCVFKEVTGMNWRRDPTQASGRPKNAVLDADFETRPFVQAVRKAQKLALECLLTRPRLREFQESKETYPLQYEVPQGFLSGAIGEIKVPINNKRFARVLPHPRYPNRPLMAIPEPTRNAPEELKDQDKEKAVQLAYKKLIKGKRWKTSCVECWSRSVIQWDETNQEFLVDKIPWEKARHLDISLPIMMGPTWEASPPYPPCSKSDSKEDDDDDVEMSTEQQVCTTEQMETTEKGGYGGLAPHVGPLIMRGRGIHSLALEPLALKKVLDGFSISHVRAAYIALVGKMGSSIEFKEIGREGGGSDTHILLEEVGGYHVLLHLSLLYGDALMRAPYKTTRFLVRTGPLLWKLRDQLREYLKRRQELTGDYDCKETWPGPFESKDEKKKVLYHYQKEDVDEMEKEIDLGRNGHFLKEPTGAGKTRVSVELAKLLWKRNMLMPYIFILLPSMAIDATVKEWQNMGFTVRRLWANKGPPSEKDKWRKLCRGPKKIKIRQGVVYLVQHDFLRKECISKVLVEKAPLSLIIIDEADLTLHSSQKTTYAQQFQRLAAHFLLMTATVFLSRDRGKLIPYLSTITDFPVTKQNVLVAVGAMKTSDFKYDIKVERQIVHCEWENDSQRKRFLKYASPGPHHDSHKALKIAYECTATRMAQDLKQRLSESDCTGVLFDACSQKHLKKIQNTLLKHSAIESDKLFVLENSNDVIQITAENVKSKQVKNYDAAIVTAFLSRSFSMTKFHDYWSSPIHSSTNTRVQTIGRLIRKEQTSPIIYHRIFVIGPLLMILEEQQTCQSLEMIMTRYMKTMSVGGS